MGLAEADPHDAFVRIAELARAASTSNELFHVGEVFVWFLERNLDDMRPEIEQELAANPGLRGALRLEGSQRAWVDEFGYWTPPRSMRGERH